LPMGLCAIGVWIIFPFISSKCFPEINPVGVLFEEEPRTVAPMKKLLGVIANWPANLLDILSVGENWSWGRCIVLSMPSMLIWGAFFIWTTS